MGELSKKALEIAISQLGQREDPIGSNWGHPVIDYLASVNIDFQASWCMAFVYWCFNEAAKGLGTVNPLVKTGGVIKAYNASGSHKSDTPQPTDIFIMDFGNGTGHTGIIEHLDEEFIYTIEGNTNDLGIREGFEVCRRKRSRKTIKGYLSF